MAKSKGTMNGKSCGMKMSGKMQSPMVSPKITTNRKLGGK